MNHSSSLRRMTMIFAACFSLGALAAPKAPRVAVTDLAYEERVSEYFRVVSASHKSSPRTMQEHYKEDEGVHSYINRGELRKFTADIKGEILRSGRFDLVQARPYTAKKNEKLYDIIGRIKKGMFPRANYVLFGSINSIEFRREELPIASTNSVSHVLSLELVGEFSLINTKNYEVIAAFSATGSGQDVRLMDTAGGRAVLSRGKVVAETSKSLGEDVARQLGEQLGGFYGGAMYQPTPVQNFNPMMQAPQRDEIIIYR